MGFIPKVTQNIDVICSRYSCQHKPASHFLRRFTFREQQSEKNDLFQVAQLLLFPPSSVAGFCATAYRSSDIVQCSPSFVSQDSNR